MNEKSKNILLNDIKRGVSLRYSLQNINKTLPAGEEITFKEAYKVVGNLFDYYKEDIESSKDEKLAKELDNLEFLSDIAAQLLNEIDSNNRWNAENIQHIEDFEQLIKIVNDSHQKNTTNKTKVLDFLMKITDVRMKVLTTLSNINENRDNNSFTIQFGMNQGETKVDKDG